MLPAFRPLLKAAGKALQAELGDLEEVWTDPTGEKQERLLSLPFAAVKALLADNRTRVTSENTAVYTAARWLDAADGIDDPVGSAEAIELRRLIRVAHLTPRFAASLAGGQVWQGEERELLMQAPLLQADDVVEDLFPELEDDHPLLFSTPRPASSVKSVVLEWSPTLADIKAEVVKGERFVSPAAAVWQGWPFHIQLSQWDDGELSMSAEVHAPSFIPQPWVGKSAFARATYSTYVQPVGGAAAAAVFAGGANPNKDTSTNVFVARRDKDGDFSESSGIMAWGSPLPGQVECEERAWPPIEAALRAEGLVHGEGAAEHLKLALMVEEVR